MIAVLLWAYYSSQIVLLSAEFTQVYANMYGSRMTPAPDAIPMTPERRADEGLTPA